mgnify:CR=1 FL=1
MRSRSRFFPSYRNVDCGSVAPEFFLNYINNSENSGKPIDKSDLCVKIVSVAQDNITILRNCVRVARQSLNLFVAVRIRVPQPKIGKHLMVPADFYFSVPAISIAYALPIQRRYILCGRTHRHNRRPLSRFASGFSFLAERFYRKGAPIPFNNSVRTTRVEHSSPIFSFSARQNSAGFTFSCPQGSVTYIRTPSGISSS